MGTDTLIDDIYHLVSTHEVPSGVDVEVEIEKFGEAMKALMRNEFSRSRIEDTRKLRLSSIGRPDKFIWNKFHDTTQEELTPNTYVKFLYGNLIEEMILFLTRMSGHEVTDEQKKCEVEGVIGHMDCKIDGVVTDVKSSSTFGFKKFKERRVPEDDQFGYVDQIKAYAHSEGERKFAWLAMDKQNGHLTFCVHDLDDKSDPMHELLQGDIAERVRHIKKVVEQVEPSDFCYPDVPEGKAGNRKLAVGCSYCLYKEKCYPDLRTFLYARGPVFLTKVVKEPNVMEVRSDF